MIEEYIILKSAYTDTLVFEVNKRLKAGWKLYGELQISVYKDGSSAKFQAMVR